MSDLSSTLAAEGVFGDPDTGAQGSDTVGELRAVLNHMSLPPVDGPDPAAAGSAYVEADPPYWGENGGPAPFFNTQAPTVNWLAIAAPLRRAGEAVARTTRLGAWMLIMLGAEVGMRISAEGKVVVEAPHGRSGDVQVQAPEVPTPCPPSDMPVRMREFRRHVDKVKRSRAEGSKLSMNTDYVAADVRVAYDEIRDRVAAALTDRLGSLQRAQANVPPSDLEGIRAIGARIECERLTPEGIADQAARAAFFQLQVRHTSDVLARAGVKPVSVNL